MIVLAFDHNANIEQYRRRYYELAALRDVRLRLIIPKHLAGYSKVRRFDPITGREPIDIVALENLQDGSVHRGFYWNVFRLVRELMRFQPDIVFVHGELESWYSLQVGVLTRLFRPRAKVVLLTFMNINLYEIGFPYKLGFLYRIFYRWCADSVDGVIACTKEGIPALRTNGFGGVIRHIGVGVDTGHFARRDSSALRRALGLSRFVIGFAGRLEDEKGIDTLIEAAARLGAGVQVLLVGGGRAREALLRLATSRGVDVRVVDAVGYDRMPEYFSCMDALVLPSRTTKYWKEQFGRVLIEAMACGVPVVGSSSGEIPEVVGEAGLIFAEGSADGLASQLRRLLEEPGLRGSLSERGRERVASMYTWRKVASDMHEMFCELASPESVEREMAV
ncbi:MAG: glycosyltransferase family 4 protein [Elusimicrobia bacterium]|nr:glycosyltransferase family 4 protein [Elusimicrobiota bacterium]